MKKLAVLALALATVTSAFASNFTGLGLGLEADINKHDVNVGSVTYSGDNKTGVNLVGSYGIAHPNKLVSTVDVKAGLGGVDLVDVNGDKIEQKQSYSVGYSLGYTGLNDNFMPYAKVNYNTAKLEGTGSLYGEETVQGFGWGVGAKYKFTPNIEAGVEYMTSKLDKSDVERDGSNVNVGLTYRF